MAMADYPPTAPPSFWYKDTSKHGARHLDGTSLRRGPSTASQLEGFLSPTPPLKGPVVESVGARIRREDTQRREELARLKQHVSELLAAKEMLESEFDTAQEQLAKATKLITTMQEALALDVEMSNRKPLRFKADLSSSPMWHTVSFAMVKKERERRFAETAAAEAERTQQEKRHREAWEHQHEMHRADLERMELARQSDLELIRKLNEELDRIRLAKDAVALLGEQRTVVEATWEAARRENDQSTSAFDADVDELSSWHFHEFLESLNIHKIVARTFEALVAHPHCPVALQKGGGRRAFLRALGSCNDATGRLTVNAVLRSSPILEELTDAIWKGLQKLSADATTIESGRTLIKQRAAASSGQGRYDTDWLDKDQCTEKLVELQRIPSFSASAPLRFETLVNELHNGPVADGMDAIMREHCAATDSDRKFLVPDARIETTSRLEYYLVTDPPAALQLLGLRAWPAGQGELRTPPALGSRRVLPLDAEVFTEGVANINKKLAALGDHSGLGFEALCAMRLYTGPLAQKYACALRVLHEKRVRQEHPLLDSYMDDVSCGNLYSTTMHHLSLGLSKLAKLERTSVVYLAVASPVPDSFFRSPMHVEATPTTAAALKDDDNCIARLSDFRGAVHLGLSTATRHKDKAFAHAAEMGRAVVLELQQGAAGQSVSFSKESSFDWLAQLPWDEATVLLEPLMTCEVHRTRLEGGFVIVEVRPSTNPAVVNDERQSNADMALSEVMMAKLDVGQPAPPSRSRPANVRGRQELDISWEKRMLARLRTLQEQQSLFAQAAALVAKATEQEIDDLTTKHMGSNNQSFVQMNRRCEITVQAALSRMRAQLQRAQEGEKRASRQRDVTAKEVELLEGWGRKSYHEDLAGSLEPMLRMARHW